MPLRKGIILAPNNTAYTRWNCHSGRENPVANFVDPSRTLGARLLFLGQAGHAGWPAMLLIKVGDVETNPGPTIARKQVWICDIFHKQIQVRKQISIRCKRIEHWVHLRCE